MAEQIVKLKNKQWYPILAPKQFNNVVLGETPVYNTKSMLGKTLKYSLMNLTNDIKKQNVNLTFKVVDVEGTNARTALTAYEVIPYSIRRFIKKDIEKVDISITCETADNILIRIKPFIITKVDVKGSIGSKLINVTTQFVVKSIKKMKFDEVIDELINHKFQNSMKDTLNKIFPLKLCEIRYFGIKSDSKHKETKTEQQSEEKQLE